MEKVVGGKLLKAHSLTELAFAEHDFFLDKKGAVNYTKFDRTACQCCGFREKPGATCVCDGVVWHQLPDGRIECEPHRLARAIKGEKKWWDFRR